MRHVLASFERVAASLMVAALLSGLAAGCKTASLGAQERIVQLNLMTVPVALDLDGKPGPDGISVKVYAGTKDNPKQVAIRRGTLEMLMFDGPFHRQTAPPPILKTFQFAAEEIRRAEFSAEIGMGYLLTLSWGTNVPTQRIVSVAARYTAPDGQTAVSRPSSVTVLAR